MNVVTAACTAEEDGPWLHLRREPFEYGLLPLPSLMHLDGIASLRERLISHAFDEGSKRVRTSGVAAALCIPEAQAHLVVDTLASVLPADDGIHVDFLARAAIDEIDSIGADIDDLIILLYIQNYRKPQPRPHRDAAAVGDVWPSNSAIDRFLPSLSPLQMRLARRSVPFQAEEEAHQLTWVQKHLAFILGLLSESTHDEENDPKVVAAEKFHHLALIFQAHDSGGNLIHLNQAAPFFANSDPDMPAAPVLLDQVLDWMLDHICAASEHVFEKGSTKDNGPLYISVQDVDVTMVDASSTAAASGITSNGLGQSSKDWYPDRITFVDAVTRASIQKGEADVKGNTVKVSNCHDAAVYVLAPFKYGSVIGCSDSVIVLGPVGKALRVEHCERIQLVVPCARICIANCRECVFYLGVNQQPLILGDNHKLQVAPYNTFYPKLETHLAAARVNPAVNRWDKFSTLGVVDPHDSLSHPAGVADAVSEGATFVHPDRYTTFMIPRFPDEDQEQSITTMSNPFILPKTYVIAQQQRDTSMENLKKMLKEAPLSESSKQELSNAVHAHFKDWIYASGNVRHFYDLQL